VSADPSHDSPLDELSAALAGPEPLSRALETTPAELTGWLEEIARFSRDYLALNAEGPAWLGEGAGPPTALPLPLEPVPMRAVAGRLLSGAHAPSRL